MLGTPPRLSQNPSFAPLLSLCESVLYTSAELAKHWRYTEQHVHAMRRLGSGPAFVKMPSGGAVRYRLSEVMAWEIHGHGGPITSERLALAVHTIPTLTLDQRHAVEAHLRAVLFPDSGVTPTITAEPSIASGRASNVQVRPRGRPPK